MSNLKSESGIHLRGVLEGNTNGPNQRNEAHWRAHVLEIILEGKVWFKGSICLNLLQNGPNVLGL